MADQCCYVLELKGRDHEDTISSVKSLEIIRQALADQAHVDVASRATSRAPVNHVGGNTSDRGEHPVVEATSQRDSITDTRKSQQFGIATRFPRAAQQQPSIALQAPRRMVAEGVPPADARVSVGSLSI